MSFLTAILRLQRGYYGPTHKIPDSPRGHHRQRRRRRMDPRPPHPYHHTPHRKPLIPITIILIQTLIATVTWRRRFGGRAALRAGPQAAPICAPLTATSVRLRACNFFITCRTWTLTVLSHMFNSYAMTLFGLP